MQQRVPSGVDPLAVLADVASASVTEEDDATPKCSQDRSNGGGSKRSSDNTTTVTGRPARQVRKKRASAAAAAAAPTCSAGVFVAAGAPEELLPTPEHLPGSLLLAQDPQDLSRHWVVIVADTHDLPKEVVQGGSLANGGRGFPQSLQVSWPCGASPQLV